MTKAYHIDSVNRKITEVIINNYTDIYPKKEVTQEGTNGQNLR
jgi:hypothetical protein